MSAEVSTSQSTKEPRFACKALKFDPDSKVQSGTVFNHYLSWSLCTWERWDTVVPMLAAIKSQSGLFRGVVFDPDWIPFRYRVVSAGGTARKSSLSSDPSTPKTKKSTSVKTDPDIKSN